MMNAALHVGTKFSHWGRDGEPEIAQADHETAYRWWPVLEAHCCLLIALVWDVTVGPCGGLRAFAHKALPFGALAAVWGYTRLSQGLVLVMQRLFAFAQQAWVDDFLRIAPRRHAALQQWLFHRLHELWGIPVKTAKSKLGTALQALGLALEVGPNICKVRLTETRRAKLDADLRAYLRRDATETELQQLAGGLTFACEALAGRIGRAYAATVARSKGPTQALKRAMKWRVAYLQHAPCKLYQQGHQRPQAMAWVDGEWDQETQQGAVGGILFTAGGARAFSAEIPETLRTELLTQGKTAQHASRNPRCLCPRPHLFPRPQRRRPRRLRGQHHN